MASVRGYAKWLGTDDPLHRWRAPAPAAAEPHPLPEGIDGVVRMLDATTNEELKILVALCGLCGLRIGEAIKVAPKDYLWARKTIMVSGKGNKRRVVPLSEAARRVLEGPLARSGLDRSYPLIRMSERSARAKITALGAKAGLARRVSSHDLRATFATEVYKQSQDLRAVQLLLGHSDIQTTTVYTGVNMDTMRGVVEIVP